MKNYFDYPEKERGKILKKAAEDSNKLQQAIESKIKEREMMPTLSVSYHTYICDICSEMERRGYFSEANYWDDFFKKKRKPIKYKLRYTTKTGKVWIK